MYMEVSRRGYRLGYSSGNYDFAQNFLLYVSLVLTGGCKGDVHWDRLRVKLLLAFLDDGSEKNILPNTLRVRRESCKQNKVRCICTLLLLWDILLFVIKRRCELKTLSRYGVSGVVT